MFQWLKNILYPKQKYPHDLENVDLIVTFLVRNNNIEILTNWANKDQKYANALGQLLFLINNGYLTESIVESLLNYSKKDKDTEEFIKLILQSWENITVEHTKDSKEDKSVDNDDPIVEPDSFTSVGKEE